MMIIGTNMAALRAQNALGRASSDVQKAMLRLTTGKKINSAADDPAGFATAESMKTQLLGMSQARRNALDAISVTQTSDATLAEVASMAQRMRELAVQSASGSYSPTDRRNMDAEVKELTTQITQTLQRARFNGIALFDTSAMGMGSGTPGTPGYGTSMQIQLGSRAGDVTRLSIDNIDTSWATGATIATVSDANSMLTTMDDFLGKVTQARAGLGAQQNGLEVSISNLDTSMLNTNEAMSRIVDADYAAESMAFARAQILTQTATAMLAQANQMQKLVLELLR